MTKTTERLFSNNWTVRLSDPGEEGTHSHLFETTYVSLDAHIEGKNVEYVFTRKVEDKVVLAQQFTDLQELFKFCGDYLDPVSLGLLGVKIGQLGL